MNITRRLSAARAACNLVLVVLLGGALDPDLAALRSADARLAGVAFRLQTANAVLCSDARPLPAFTLQTIGQFPARDRPRVAAQLGLGDLPMVAAVAPDSAAARAGLKVGDSVVAVDGVALGPTTASAGYAGLAAAADRIELALTDRSAELRLQDRVVQITGDRGCPSRAELVPGGFKATGADGRYIQISERMLRLAASDDELAVVVAHELAHNILKHRARRTPSRESEFAADWLGVWLVARAGYDLAAVPRFWQRLQAQTDYGILSDGSHPSWKKRLAAIDRAIVEVERQRAAGEPLMPSAEQQLTSQAQIRR
ncbi:MAG: M48 family metallopeptidase [Sphingomonadaceae bacterium]